MMLPNFICPGAQKSATTTLHDILIQHPEIYLPSKKETHFFDIDKKFKKGIDFYLNQYYSDVENEKIVGDITPGYMFFENSLERIVETLGEDIKILFMLRNPIERAYSHYWMSYRRTYENKSFEKGIELEKERIKKDYFNRSHFSYIERGFYAKQIKRFLKVFPKKNMKFIIFNEFINNKSSSIEEILYFLNLDTKVPLELDKKSNSAFLPRFKKITSFLKNPPYVVKMISKIFSDKTKKKIINIINEKNKQNFKKPKMKTVTRNKLIEIYYEDMKELENITNKDLSFWYNKKNNYSR